MTESVLGIHLDLRMSVFKDFIIENNVTFRQLGPVSCMSVTLKLGNPNDFMDINYKCLLKELKGTSTIKTAEKKPIEKSVGGNKGGISGDFLARLERKWCGYGKSCPVTYASYSYLLTYSHAKGYHEAVEDNDDDALEEENSDSGSDAEGANNNNGDASIIANDAANINPVKKRRRNRDDVYDHEDWFVDDSEDAVVLRVEAKRYETKHSGFFVSEGSLDVNTARSIASTKPVKKTSVPEVKESSATNNKVSSVKAKTPQSASGGGATLSQSTTPLNKLISTISSTSPTRIVSNGSSEKQVSGADEKQKRTRTYIPKPEYVAAESVKGGIDVVKEEVKRLKSMNDNRKFHFIPDALDGYLLLLDDLVRQHNPEIYNNTHVGYFEEISQAILDTQKPKVMKSYLTCIRAKRDAKHHLQEYSRLTDELVHEAKNNIVPFVEKYNYYTLVQSHPNCFSCTFSIVLNPLACIVPTYECSQTQLIPVSQSFRCTDAWRS